MFSTHALVSAAIAFYIQLLQLLKTPTFKTRWSSELIMESFVEWFHVRYNWEQFIGSDVNITIVRLTFETPPVVYVRLDASVCLHQHQHTRGAPFLGTVCEGTLRQQTRKLRARANYKVLTVFLRITDVSLLAWLTS